MTKASSLRKPRCCSIRISRTSSAVRHTPQTSGSAEQQLQRDGGADHLGQVAGDDRDLAQQPERQGDRPA